MKKDLYNSTGSPGFKRPSPTEVGENEICVIGGETWFEKSAVLKRMHISERTLRNWQKKKLLRSARMGGRRYYPESEIQAKLRDALH
jgi:MerR HTH family regulatory protein